MPIILAPFARLCIALSIGFETKIVSEADRIEAEKKPTSKNPYLFDYSEIAFPLFKKVFDNAIIELRLSAKNDPATYAKFNTSQASQEKIMLNALKRSGVTKEADAKAMLQCALPR